MIVENCIG